MQRFFTPSPRRLLIEPHGYTEVTLAVPIEAFLNYRWDWSDFRAFATGDVGEMGKIMLIIEDTFIWVEDGDTRSKFDELNRHAIQCAKFTSPSDETHVLVLATVGSSASLSAGARASSIFWRAVTTSNCVKLNLENTRGWSNPLPETALLQFVEASLSLHLLEFGYFHFKEADCRALATLERKSIEVTFDHCSFDVQGAEATFIEWLRHSQVVTKLALCTMERSIISSLDGNSSVKRLIVFAGGDDKIRSLALALPGNLGIEKLSVSSLNHETWCLLLRSLWAHPRILSLSLCMDSMWVDPPKSIIMNAVLRFVQCNTVVRTINLPNAAKDEEFFQDFIVPRLEMNRTFFEEQRRALGRADLAVRGQLLGRALHVVRKNPDLLFRFLSDNVPSFV
jgi:hypothetical protein